MKTQLAKISYYGTYRIIYNDSGIDKPYSIYYEYHTFNSYEGSKKHKQKLGQYADFKSCMIHITEVI